mmetsp:Transcript_35767/g.78123  ORF Transcript_35767/g.78123 Transcript_35767/m.78123 type:complete len:210 (+) Transcript_35767:493-1122(+)
MLGEVLINRKQRFAVPTPRSIDKDENIFLLLGQHLPVKSPRHHFSHRPGVGGRDRLRTHMHVHLAAADTLDEFCDCCHCHLPRLAVPQILGALGLELHLKYQSGVGLATQIGLGVVSVVVRIQPHEIVHTPVLLGHSQEHLLVLLQVFLQCPGVKARPQQAEGFGVLVVPVVIVRGYLSKWRELFHQHKMKEPLRGPGPLELGLVDRHG